MPQKASQQKFGKSLKLRWLNKRNRSQRKHETYVCGCLCVCVYGCKLFASCSIKECLQDTHTSVVGAHTSIFRTHASVVGAHNSVVVAHTSIFRTHTSVVGAHTNVVVAHTSIFRTHTSVFGAHNSVFWNTHQFFWTHTSIFRTHSRGDRCLEYTIRIHKSDKQHILAITCTQSVSPHCLSNYLGRHFSSSFSSSFSPAWTVVIGRVGQNRMYTPYMTINLVISLPKIRIPYLCIYMVLARHSYRP